MQGMDPRQIERVKNTVKKMFRENKAKGEWKKKPAAASRVRVPGMEVKSTAGALSDQQVRESVQYICVCAFCVFCSLVLCMDGSVWMSSAEGISQPSYPPHLVLRLRLRLHCLLVQGCVLASVRSLPMQDRRGWRKTEKDIAFTFPPCSSSSCHSPSHHFRRVNYFQVNVALTPMLDYLDENFEIIADLLYEVRF